MSERKEIGAFQSLSGFVKKSFIKILWRMQQVYLPIGVGFWALNLALVLHPYVKWRFYNWGITNIYAQMLIISSFIIMFILIMGLIYDKRFRLWREQSVVTQERNPYSQWKMTIHLLIISACAYLPIIEKYGTPEDVKVMRLFIHKTLRQPESRRLLAQTLRFLQKQAKGKNCRLNL